MACINPPKLARLCCQFCQTNGTYLLQEHRSYSRAPECLSADFPAINELWVFDRDTRRGLYRDMISNCGLYLSSRSLSFKLPGSWAAPSRRSDSGCTLKACQPGPSLPDRLLLKIFVRPTPRRCRLI